MRRVLNSECEGEIGFAAVLFDAGRRQQQQQQGVRGGVASGGGGKIDSGPSEMRPCTQRFSTAVDGPGIREEKWNEGKQAGAVGLAARASPKFSAEI